MGRVLSVALVIVATLIATVTNLYVRNATPGVLAIATADAAAGGAPWVVKLHAQWCPVCMLSMGMWSQIEERYAGRVRSKEIVAWIDGSRDFADYEAAIDAAIAAAEL